MSTDMSLAPELRARLDQSRAARLVAGCVGLLLSLAAWAISPAHFFPSYLVGYLFWLGIALGCSGLTMLHHLTGGSWGLVIRRPLESGASTVLPLALLFLPLALGVSTFYPWARGESSGHEAALETTAYLNERFFLIRAAVYFVVWIALALLLNGWSNRQDLTSDPAPSLRLQTLAGPGIVLLFLAGSFSAIDWMMSLDPRWTSTIYGVMVITGDALATLAMMIVVSLLLGVRQADVRNGDARQAQRPGQPHARFRYALGLHVVLSVPDHLEREPVGRDPLVPSPDARRLAVGGPGLDPVPIFLAVFRLAAP